MAQAGQDPAFHHLHPHLRLGLVLGLVGPCREDGGVIVAGQLLIGLVGLWRIAAGLGDSATKVVGNQQLTDAAKEAEGPLMGVDPVRQLLALKRGS